MSVILFYKNNQKSNLQSLELRGFGGVVGIDKQGVITNNNIVEEFFSVYAVGEEYVLHVDNNNIVLSKFFEINIRNREFFFHTITPTAESLSYSMGNIDNCIKEDRLEINVSYVSEVLTIKLFKNIEYYLGSSPFSSIYLDKKEFAPYHCKLIFNESGLNIIDIAGTLKKEKDNLYSNGLALISF